MGDQYNMYADSYYDEVEEWENQFEEFYYDGTYFNHEGEY